MNNFPKRKSIRLKNYDYSSNGFYFVTICTRDNRPIIEEYKEKVDMTLLNLPERFSGLTIDYYSIMPTHVHVIFIFEDIKVSLGEIVRAFKALVSKITGEKNFWQRNYYEHVIRTHNVLSKIREYVQNNPLVERIKFEKFYETGSMNRTPTEL